MNLYHTTEQSINGLLLKVFIKVQEAIQSPGINGVEIIQRRGRECGGMGKHFSKGWAVTIGSAHPST